MTAGVGEGFDGADARAARKRLGLTQDQVAAEVGVTKQHISNFELGRYRLGWRVRADLAKMLGLPMDVHEDARPSVIDEINASNADVYARLERLTDAFEELSRRVVDLMEQVEHLPRASEVRPQDGQRRR